MGYLEWAESAEAEQGAQVSICVGDLRVIARKIDEIIDRTTVARGAFENGEAISEIKHLLEETFSISL